MKTVLVGPHLFGAEGGIARILRLYLMALSELKGESLGYIMLFDGEAPSESVRKYSSRPLLASIGCRGGKLRFIWNVWRRAWNAEQVICGHLHQLPVLWALKKLRPRLRYYLVAHGIEVWRPYGALERAALQRAERILCVSEYTRRQMLRFLSSLDPAKLVVVPNGLDPHLAVPSAAPKRTLDPQKPVILVVSRLVASDPYKGVDTMIEAMPGILEQFPGATLRIVGGGDDVPRLMSLARTFQVDSSVVFVGFVDDLQLQAEYSACDIFSLPSRKEGFGLVYLEAMIHGKSCLAARAGGAPEVVNRVVGALVEYGHTEQIALAALDLIRNPRESAELRWHVDRFTFPYFLEHLKHVIYHQSNP